MMKLTASQGGRLLCAAPPPAFCVVDKPVPEGLTVMAGCAAWRLVAAALIEIPVGAGLVGPGCIASPVPAGRETACFQRCYKSPGDSAADR